MGQPVKSSVHLALYGGVAMKRMRCPKCHRMALILDGGTACCDVLIDEEAESTKRMCQPSGRRYLPAPVKRLLLEKQDHRCIYCGKTFGSIVRRNGNELILQVHYDHMVPFAYVDETKTYNIAAACHVCNLLKSSTMFQTVEEAQLWLRTRRQEKGYDF